MVSSLHKVIEPQSARVLILQLASSPLPAFFPHRNGNLSSQPCLGSFQGFTFQNDLKFILPPKKLIYTIVYS